MKKNLGLIIGILVLIIILLLGIIAYFMIIKPHFQEYVYEKQVEAQNIVVSAIAEQVQQLGYVQIPVGNETLVLVPYTPQSS